MNNKLFIWSITLLVVFLISSCKDSEKGQRICIPSSCVNEIPLSEVADKVDYIALESKKECMLSDWADIFMTKEYIVAIDKEIYLFDKTGKFLRKIGRKGQGPDEYISTMGTSFYINYSSVVADKGNAWIEYGCSETVPFSLIQKPDVKSFMRFSANTKTHEELSMFIQPILYSMKLDTNLYAGYLHNIDGHNPYKLLYYQKDGTVVKQYPNYLHFEDNPNNIAQYQPSFYSYNGQCYFKEMFNDTLFVMKETELQPYLIFDLGENNLPYEQQDQIEDMSRYKQFRLIGETDSHLYFIYDYDSKRYTGIINKTNFEVKVSEDGFVDDIVNTFSLTPNLIYEKEMLCVLSALQIGTTPSLSKNFESLKEDDNPVVAIVSLK